MHVAYYAASYEDILDRALCATQSALISKAFAGHIFFFCAAYQMRVLQLLHHCDIVQLDVEILVHALQCPADGNVVFELDRDFVVD